MRGLNDVPEQENLLRLWLLLLFLRAGSSYQPAGQSKRLSSSKRRGWARTLSSGVTTTIRYALPSPSAHTLAPIWVRMRADAYGTGA